MKQIKFFRSTSFNPYFNLAMEECLMDEVDDDTLIVYMWQNQHTVVIGKNQNHFQECHLDRMKEDKRVLARRLSGGGAVYHDLGNICFTFVATTPNYDTKKNSEVILNALKPFGIEAYFSGRNDLLIDGAKFSGHAYYSRGNAHIHHGTLLYNVDMADMAKYLSPSSSKLKSKGVASVRSRVTNLIDHAPTMTVEGLVDEIEKAVVAYYDLPIVAQVYETEGNQSFQDKFAFYGSDDWLYKPVFTPDHSFAARFDWGDIQIHLMMEDGMISQALVFSDAMNTDVVDKSKALLLSKPFDLKALEDEFLASKEPQLMDIASLFEDARLEQTNV